MERWGICFGLALSFLASGCISESAQQTRREDIGKRLEDLEHVSVALNPFPLVRDPAYIPAVELRTTYRMDPVKGQFPMIMRDGPGGTYLIRSGASIPEP